MRGYASAEGLRARQPHGRVTTTEAIDLPGVPRPTAIRHLQHLVDAGPPEAVRQSPDQPAGLPADGEADRHIHERGTRPGG